MDKSRAIMDGLLTTAFVMLMLHVFSGGTVTVPMQNDAVGVATSTADDPSFDEINAKFAEMSASL